MPVQTHPLILSFLSALEKELKGLPNRDSTVEEIYSHLFDAVERLVEEGTEEEGAIQEALRRFGDPKRLGKALRAARRPWYLRWTFLIPSSLAIACALGIVALSVLTEISLRASEEFIRQQDRSLSLFFKDQDALKKYSFLGPTGRKSDAGVFLNARVEWEGDKTAERYRHPTSAFSEAQRNLLRGQDWLKTSEPKELHSFDLSWMAGLDKFDHWDIWATDGAGRDNVLSGIPWVQTSVPKYGPFISMARLRYIRGLRTGEALKALHEVRQLIVLINSNELLISSMIAAALFRDETTFYNEAVRRHLIRSKDWAVLPEEDRLAFKRVAYSAGEWMDLLTPPEMLQRLAEHSKEMVGICGALAESENIGYITKMYFEPRIWPEVDLAPNFARLAELVNQNRDRCRLTYSTIAPPESKWIPYDDAARNLWTLYHRLAVSVPVLRRYEGASFHRAYQPHWAGQYDRLIAEQDQASNRAPAQVGQ